MREARFSRRVRHNLILRDRHLTADQEILFLESIWRISSAGLSKSADACDSEDRGSILEML